MEILVKNRNFGQQSKFGSKFGIIFRVEKTNVKNV